MSSTNRKGAKPDGNYSTPLWAVEIILPHLPEAKTILDPCAGSGNILRVIAKMRAGCYVSLAGIELDPERAAGLVKIEGVTSSLQANALRPAVEWNSPELIVMNPPFKFAEIFTRRALAALAPGGTAAVLLRLGFAASIERVTFWQDKVADMAILSRRPSFGKIRKSTSDSADYAWFIFGPQATGKWYRLEVGTAKRRADAPIVVTMS